MPITMTLLCFPAVYMMVHRTPFFLPWLYPGLTWRMPDSSSDLYLTFDDGPIPGVTEFVLETLRKYTVTATFFCIGDNIRKHPYLFREILQEGHAVGNHTFHHLNGWRTLENDYLKNIQWCEEEIVKHSSAGGSSRLFRPPYGRITRSQIKLLDGYKIIMWDVLSVDYNRHLSEKVCFANTVKACRNGSIVVFHDSYKAEKNLRFALPKMIEHFISRGFTFKAIT